MSQTAVESLASARTSSLRQVLALNACTSLAAGLGAVIARGPVTDLLGLVGDRAELVVFAVGVGLIVFAVEVALAARRPGDEALARNAGLISMLDVAWVVATVAVVATVDMSGTGQFVAMAMGLGVAGLAVLQVRLR